MSIATEITRLQNAKAAIKTAIEGKGVTVPDATLMDGMAALIDAIEAGGGDTSVEDAIVDRTISGEYTNSRVTKVELYAFYRCSNLTKVSFPKATYIGTYALSYCSYLKSIDLPLVTKIESYAFYNDAVLRSINAPNVESLGNYAFLSCRFITDICFPKVQTISRCAFSNCYRLKTAILSAVTSIDYQSFYSCSGLTSLVIKNESAVCSLTNTNAFTSSAIASGTGYIYVPDALVDSYKAATNWSTYAAQIKPLSEYTEA